MLSGHISIMFLLHYKPTRLWNWKRFWLKAIGYRSVNLFRTVLVESQKDNNVIQCFTENQKGAITVQSIWYIVSWEPEGHYCRSKMFHWEPEGCYCHWLCTAIAPFWFSTEHLWAAIMPFWLSTDDMNL